MHSKIILLLFSLCFCITTISAQSDKYNTVKKINALLIKSVDKKGAKQVTGIKQIKFTGDTLVIETILFKLLFPSLNFQQLTDVTEQKDFSPVGYTTLWLNFDEEQQRFTDNMTTAEKVKHLSLYVKPTDSEILKKLFLLLKN